MFRRKFLRKLFDPKINSLDKLRTNQGIKELYSETNIIEVLKSSRLGLAEYMWKSEATGWKLPDIKRLRGKLRQRWNNRII